MKVFVYGTLRKKGRLHGAIEHAVKDIKKAYLRGATMYDLTGGCYPHVCPTSPTKYPDRFVIGELISFKPEMENDSFRSMDRIELCAGYDRINVEVELEDGSTEIAVIYVIPEERAERILKNNDLFRRVDSGDWMKYLSIKRG